MRIILVPTYTHALPRTTLPSTTLPSTALPSTALPPRCYKGVRAGFSDFTPSVGRAGRERGCGETVGKNLTGLKTEIKAQIREIILSRASIPA